MSGKELAFKVNKKLTGSHISKKILLNIFFFFFFEMMIWLERHGPTSENRQWELEISQLGIQNDIQQMNFWRELLFCQIDWTREDSYN